MSAILLDDDLKAKLNGLNQHLEIRDASGNRVGWFVPEEAYMQMLYAQAHAALDRVEAEEASHGTAEKWDGKSGRTTAEAIAYVKKMAEQLATGGQ